MDELAAMRVFVRVVETGSLAAAGRAVGMAPSSITRRINELEDLLGVRLLNRSTRKLSLTEAGEIYFERIRDVIRSADEANLAVTEKRAQPSGILRLTVPSAISRMHVAPAVAAFQAQYPAVRVVMLVTDRIVDVIGEGLDIAIRIGRLEDSSLMARKLGVARRLVCASPAYFRSAGKPSHPEEIAEHACLTFRSHPGHNIWRFRNGNDTFDVRATGSFFSDDAETLTAGACAGLGLIHVPEWLVGPEISAGRLVEVLSEFEPEPTDTPLYAVYAGAPYVAPKVRALVDFLAGRFSNNYDWRERH